MPQVQVPPEAVQTFDPLTVSVQELRAAGWRAWCSYAQDCTTIEHYLGADGFSVWGYDRYGYNRDGFDRYGYNRDGFDRDGYDWNGYDRDGYRANGYNRDGYDRDGDYNEDYDTRLDVDDNYYDDDDDRDDDNGLLNYSYKPAPIFHGDKGPYFGMEIEVTTDAVRRLVDIVREDAGDLIYCKEDGSVRGAEMVTHPMSYEWAMRSFPWEMLQRLRREADATVIPQENGIHIHVGRDAFKDSAHLYRWMKLWYRNPMDIQRLARRQSSSWATFDPEHRASQVHAAKYGKPAYTTAVPTPRERIPERYRSYRADWAPWSPQELDLTRTSRYAAINTTNAQTLEVRVFASTLRSQRAKAALQLVAASVEYTRQLDADKITHRHGWEWRAFMSWVQKAEIYPDLVAENAERRSWQRVRA